jgi:hypothetical protein
MSNTEKDYDKMFKEAKIRIDIMYEKIKAQEEYRRKFYQEVEEETNKEDK